ncbi:MAG: PorT family protein [Prevotella sp.]|nr:PorT family protein [Prevotella sp.]
MKIFFLVASVLMLSVGAFAQHEVGSLTIQPKVGLNIANYTNSDDSDPRIGLAAGAEFEYQITKMFSLSAGLLYSMQGAKESTTEQGVKVKMTAKTDYINIPILANIYVAKGFALKLGIQPSFNVNSSYKASTQGINVSGSLSDMGVDIKSFDFAIPVGLSYEFNNFVIDGRYNIGVTKMVDNDDSKNSVFQFTVGYKFNL